jgi:hypothetical protein
LFVAKNVIEPWVCLCVLGGGGGWGWRVHLVSKLKFHF